MKRMLQLLLTVALVLGLAGSVMAQEAGAGEAGTPDGAADQGTTGDQGMTADHGMTADQGTTADQGAAADQAVIGTDGAPAADSGTTSKDDDDGCSCRSGRRPAGTSTGALILMLGLGLALTRRRR